MKNSHKGDKAPPAQSAAGAEPSPSPVADPGAAAAPPEPLAPTPFPIVGIGASAGGLAAFETFFSGMPAKRDPGMAFVLVQHLAPDHKSILSDLIRRYTRMQVFEVQDGMVVQPNCTYIIPPNCDMGLLHGALHLLEPTAARGQRLPIDYFFRSLAQDQHELAIGVVLSGTGSDGTMGVRAIKDAGGMVMVQSTASCEFDGMPRSAIATGLVDYQLPPAEMPAKILAYVTHAFGKLPTPGKPATPQVEGALNKIFVLLRSHTGHDFSQYKPSTIYRRIERRMALHQLDSVAAYVKYLQQTPPEIDALFGDLLIGVTNFFRDPEAFAALETEVIPQLFAGKPASHALRVWSVGCSTGEEAYSLAILLVERMEALKQNHAVQVFATDIDARAIASARVGLFSASIADDLSPERLARFFTREPGGQSYRIQKRIRDLLVFSEHDLLKDPPFSRLDLICCRNLLIYLDSDLQKRLIPLFHYALNPGGILFLGSSEGIGEFDSLFTVLNRKAKLFQRKEDLLGVQRASLNRLAPSMTVTDAALPHRGAHRAVLAPKLPLRELMEQTLLGQIAPASALVNAGGDIVYLHGRTGMYLEPTAGEAGIQNILKMAREGLRLPLTTALHQAVSTQATSAALHIRVKTNGHYTLVNVSVLPVATPSPDTTAGPGAPLYLVMLQDDPESAQSPAAPASGDGASITPDFEARIHALTQELHAKDEYLQSTHEKLEISNEELRSSNEEMLSVNEELQSTNEELETSKEELQSINEELTTVNSELQNKVIDLSRALRQAKDALDASRARYIDLYDLAPVGYCNVNKAGLITQANLTLATLLGVARSALARHPPFSNFVLPQDQDIWYLLRKQLLASGAAQTCELRVRLNPSPAAPGGNGAFMWVQLAATAAPGESGGQVLHMAVSDITARKQAEAKLHLAASVFEHAREGIFITDPQGTILDVNESFTRMTGYSREEAVGQTPRLLKSDRQEPAFHAALWMALTTLGQWSGEIWNRRKNGEVYAQLQTISAVRDAHGKTQQYVALFSDISALKAHQIHLEHLAHFDALTNLPNRLLLADRLQQAMSQAQRCGHQLAVVYLDLDGFKNVNDRHGHAVGDQLLIAMAHAMKSTLREGDTLARMGGDELVAVLVDLDSAESCTPMLTRLLEAAAAPVALGSLILQCSASMGVTFYPQNLDLDLDLQADQLLRQADQAMYQAKLAGKNRYHVFDAAQDSHIRGIHESLQRIRLALAQHELVLHYQPKVNMHSGQIMGAEALIRWQHPDQGLLSPSAFLPLIEDHPLAVDVGEWVIDAALGQIEAWHAAGLDLPVSVNIGARQLQHSHFFERLQAILAQHPRVNPAKLVLEVLETSALADMAQISQLIEVCGKIGVKFALDDFGTGYSSLIYLKSLRVAQLKIDQSFVRNMLEDPNDLAILKGVIGLAAAFKREVIAEGVETVAHGSALLQLGCELAQGNGIAAPMLGSQLPAWAASWRPHGAWCAQPRCG